MPYSIFVTSPEKSENRWRPFEREGFEEVFGGDCFEVFVTSAGKIRMDNTIPQSAPQAIYWKLHTERTTLQGLHAAKALAKDYEDRWGKAPLTINDPEFWLCANAKQIAFWAWNHAQDPKPYPIRVPEWFVFDTIDEYKEQSPVILPPFLLRLSDSVAGGHSYLIEPHDGNKTIATLAKLLGQDKVDIRVRWGPGIARRALCVQFIESEWHGHRRSARVIVAGDKLITAYMRFATPPDWIAVAGKFKAEDGEDWLEAQEWLEEWLKRHGDMLVQMIAWLGLTFVGLDITWDRADHCYALEVQTDFSCGNAILDKPPWYNPSYPAMCKFIADNADRLKQYTPLYYNHWLNKQKLFVECFKALKELGNV